MKSGEFKILPRVDIAVLNCVAWGCVKARLLHHPQRLPVREARAVLETPWYQESAHAQELSDSIVITTHLRRRETLITSLLVALQLPFPQPMLVQRTSQDEHETKRRISGRVQVNIHTGAASWGLGSRKPPISNPKQLLHWMLPLFFFYITFVIIKGGFGDLPRALWGDRIFRSPSSWIVLTPVASFLRFLARTQLPPSFSLALPEEQNRQLSRLWEQSAAHASLELSAEVTRSCTGPCR